MYDLSHMPGAKRHTPETDIARRRPRALRDDSWRTGVRARLRESLGSRSATSIAVDIAHEDGESADNAPKTTVGRWFRDDRDGVPGLEGLRRFAGLTGDSVDYWLGLTDVRQRVPVVLADGKSLTDQELADALVRRVVNVVRAWRAQPYADLMPEDPPPLDVLAAVLKGEIVSSDAAPPSAIDLAPAMPGHSLALEDPRAVLESVLRFVIQASRAAAIGLERNPNATQEWDYLIHGGVAVYRGRTDQQAPRQRKPARR
ncbi:MAG: hypothetical protein AB1762_13740 [Gemmatimonadota bacterium]